jgi:hypothetical protein
MTVDAKIMEMNKGYQMELEKESYNKIASLRDIKFKYIRLYNKHRTYHWTQVLKSLAEHKDK